MLICAIVSLDGLNNKCSLFFLMIILGQIMEKRGDG